MGGVPCVPRQINRMSDDIPFDRKLDLEPGRADEVAPGVRRVLANNPSPFTFKGTVSYIVGHDRVAIIDPGPDDARHIAALPCRWRATVTHLSSPIRTRSFAGRRAHQGGGDGRHGVRSAPARPLNMGKASGRCQRRYGVRPDLMKDGERSTVRDGVYRRHHARPHHEPHGVRVTRLGVLFCGDHVMGWSTPVVAPPDGAMSDYMVSLHKLARRAERIYLPGHGDVVRDGPRLVEQYIRHRHGREASILRRLEKGDADIPTLVRAIYIGLDPRLTGAAGLSVLAHLEDLVARGRVATDGAPAISGTYRLASG